MRRLIYTSSVVAASPLKDAGDGYNTTMDESCWTPFHISVPYNNDFLKEYTEAETRGEQEVLKIVLKIGEDKANELEVVTLSCGLVGGGHLPYTTTSSVMLFISQVINNETHYQMLRYLEELMGKIPVVYIEDVCRAHIFCAEMPLVNGRFFCLSSYITSAEMAKYYQENFPQFHLNQEYLEGPKREIKWGSTKLEDKGFLYKHDTKTILDDCLECAKRDGEISSN